MTPSLPAMIGFFVLLDYFAEERDPGYPLLVDTCSKWGEARIMSSTAPLKSVEIVPSISTSYGLPYQIVSDNGTTDI